MPLVLLPLDVVFMWSTDDVRAAVEKDAVVEKEEEWLLGESLEERN
jgi:hypothetical protein